MAFFYRRRIYSVLLLNIMESLDKLIAGVSAEERKRLLEKIRKAGGESVSPLEKISSYEHKARSGNKVRTKLNNETWFYRVMLKLRTLFSTNTKEALYDHDILVRLAKSVSKRHKYLIDFEAGELKTEFYDGLVKLRDCALFFKSYVESMSKNPGQFYVFLGGFLAPELEDVFNKQIDPYTVPLESTQNTDELKKQLLDNLNAAILDLSPQTRKRMDCAVQGLEWISKLARLPYFRFISQFIPEGANLHRCSFINARNDYPALARMILSVVPVSNEALEILYLFPHYANGESYSSSLTNDKLLHEFSKQAVAYLSLAQQFMRAIPVVDLGCIIFGDVDWQPGDFNEKKDWVVPFRDYWKTIFEKRWDEWISEKKQSVLSKMLISSFSLSELPMLESRPWSTVEGAPKFKFEYTAGFLVWFSANKYDFVLQTVNRLLLDGEFRNFEARSELSDAFAKLTELNTKITHFLTEVAPHSNLGIACEEVAQGRNTTVSNHVRLTPMIEKEEHAILEISTAFNPECASLARIIREILSSNASLKGYAVDNLDKLRDDKNRKFSGQLESACMILDNVQKIISETLKLDSGR